MIYTIYVTHTHVTVMNTDTMNPTVVLGTTLSTRLFARALVAKWCLGHEQFVRHRVMRRVIRGLIREFILADDPAKAITDDQERYNLLTPLAFEIQSVLMVLKPKYRDCNDNRALDYRIDEMDICVKELIEQFLVRKGVIVDRDDSLESVSIETDD